jgi:hypothetical protein
MTFVLDMNEEETPVRKPLPQGIHQLLIGQATFKASSTGGRYLSIEGEIDYEGFSYKLWENFNVVNNSENAQKMGRARLKDLVFACLGKNPEGNLSEEEIIKVIENRPIYVMIIHKEGYPDRTKVALYPVDFWSFKTKENRLGKKFPTSSGEDLPF